MFTKYRDVCEKTMTSRKIQKLDPITHILKRPDTYVGSNRSVQRQEYVARFDDGKFFIERRDVTYPPGLVHIFKEVLSNAVDNVQRSREAGIACTKIRISLNTETGEISVWNDGYWIPINIDAKEKMYNHTLVFGEFLTGTNFDDTEDRLVSGRNGWGAKLTNVFSSKFVVEGLDPDEKRVFRQEWKNNMREKTDPKITAAKTKTGYTCISWIPDFEQFKMFGYSPDVLSMYLKLACDAAMLTAVSVYWNDEKIPVKNLKDYTKLFGIDVVEDSKKKELAYISTDDSEVVVVPSGGEYEAISFVNGIFTENGGVHVDAWAEALFRPIVDHYSKKTKMSMTIKDVKPFYRLFVVCVLKNPEFTTQTKTQLSSPEVKAKVEDKTTKSMLKWACSEHIAHVIDAKELAVLKSSEKKKGYRAILGYERANFAGTKKSKECTLALCEGKSAKSFAIEGMSCELFGKKGRDYFGVYALRGKILNVRGATKKDIAENKVITDIIQALNLKHGVDYSKEENYSTLNYGRLMILTDADTDGKHIAGLIINMFHHLFPTILRCDPPFIVDMKTPIARFFLKSGERVFYSTYEADEFYRENKDNISKVKYYKGLGSNSNTDIHEIFGKRIVGYQYDPETDSIIEKAFHKSKTDERKAWIEEYDPSKINYEYREKIGISDFLNSEFITHPVDNCERSLPNVVDGLKQGRRKILYACFLKNLTENTLKVAQLAGYVAEKTNYHHGEENLNGTIVKMAQCFPGSNNIPLLYSGESQFGSRTSKGDDAPKPRYIHTRLERIARYIYRKEDDPLLPCVIDDGDIVEPIFYVPVIPMILINGCDGIGTGWSSTIPAFNPSDVIAAVRMYIECESVPRIHPWYRGFKGEIKQVSETKYTIHGIVERQERVSVITEIPIGISIENVLETIEGLREKGAIKKFENHSQANTAHFIITEDGMECTAESLGLVSKIALTNMTMYDEHHRIRRYDNVEDIIRAHAKVRLEYYAKRKEYLVSAKKRERTIALNKKKFIGEVNARTFDLCNRTESDEVEELERKGYDKDDESFDYLLTMHVRVMTKERMAQLEAQIVRITADLETLGKLQPRDMWLSELEELEDMYNKWVHDSNEDSKNGSKDGSKKPKARAPRAKKVV